MIREFLYWNFNTYSLHALISKRRSAIKTYSLERKA